MQRGLSTKLQLYISARKLKNKDTFSKSDPYCKVLTYNVQSGSYTEIARTECVQNDLNPNFSVAPHIEYFFEVQQPLKFEILDYDDPTHSDFIGSCETTLGQIVGNGTSIIELRDGNSKMSGKLIVRAEEVKDCKDEIVLNLRAHHVDKKDWMGKSDPYLIFYKYRNDSQWLKVYTTEVVRKTLDPLWKPIEISVQVLCNSDFGRPIRIECWDWDRSSSDDFIGHCQVSLEDLLSPDFRIDLINPKRQAKKKKYKNSGVLEVQQCNLRKIYSFIDYLRGGTELRLMVAIDFTASNGNVYSSSSLHFLQPNAQNEYERAIMSVGAILENYDSTKHYPVLGFGGQPGAAPSVSHCFPLTGSFENPFVVGVGGILQAYHSALAHTQLSGPTLFQHVLRYATELASMNPPTQQYHVLLILTDGEIHDMPTTKACLVDASQLPLSVIIVGLGNENFRNMEELDSDEQLLRDNNGRTALRDIVQFVPFRQFGRDPYLLAEKVLAELPKQITGFMKYLGHQPLAPEGVPMEELTAETVPPMINSQ